MSGDILVVWQAAYGDPSKFSDEGVSVHKKVVGALEEARLPYTYPNPVMAYDGVDLSFATIIAGPLGTASVSALAAVAGAFVQARLGRKVRIKIGDIEVEASSAAEVERLLGKAVDVRDRLRGEADE